MSKYEGKIVYTKVIQHHNIIEFSKLIEKTIEEAQKKKFVVEIKYSTEMSTDGIVHNAIVLARIQKKRKFGRNI